MASKSKIIAELYDADGDVVSAALDNVVVTPTAHPDDGELYEWNESTTSWDAV